MNLTLANLSQIIYDRISKGNVLIEDAINEFNLKLGENLINDEEIPIELERLYRYLNTRYAVNNFYDKQQASTVGVLFGMTSLFFQLKHAPEIEKFNNETKNIVSKNRTFVEEMNKFDFVSSKEISNKMNIELQETIELLGEMQDHGLVYKRTLGMKTEYCLTQSALEILSDVNGSKWLK